MAYLKKDIRANEILNTAKKIIREDGITAITARRIAQEAGIAVGQVHHHFKSVGALKAEAFLVVVDEIFAQAAQINSGKTTFELLSSVVGPLDDSDGGVTRRIWNEAVFLAERDSDMRMAYKRCLEEWYQATIDLIQQGIANKEFMVANPSETAWRLIALSSGMDAISRIDELGFTNDAIQQQIQIVLNRELDNKG